MNDRLIMLAGILVIIAGALWIASDAARLNNVRTSLGMEPDIVTEVPRMDPELIEQEVARLSALPLPGALTEGNDKPPQLGVAADAMRECVKSIGAMIKEPKLRAKLGLMRYLLVFGAISADPDSPLLEGRFKELRPLLSEGPVKLRARLAKNEITAEQMALLQDFHATYSDVDHPVYYGLQLYEKTYEALDFESMMRKLSERRDELIDCAISRVIPVKAPSVAAGQSAN